MADVKSLIISGFTQQRTQAKQGAGSRAWGRDRGRGVGAEGVGGVVLRALRQAGQQRTRTSSGEAWER